jgi:hypothetical protein
MISSFKKYLIPIIAIVLSINTYAAVKTEDLVSLIQPATFVITVDAAGDIGIPNFVFDLEKNTFSTTTKVNGFSTTTIKVDSQGTGFFISDNGLLATDSYFIFNKINGVYRLITEKYLQNINIDKNNPEYAQAYESIFKYLVENSIKDYELDIKIVTPTNIYKSEIIHSDFSFETDENITLLKIDAKDTPSVYLSEQSLSVGEKVYSIGYTPLEKTVSEVVFNQGIINSIKDGQHQTDLPLYTSSVGSPVFDEEGMIVGVLSSSGFIIPSFFIKQILSSKNILTTPSPYFYIYKQGLQFLENRQCKTSIIEFDKLKKINPDFSVEKHIKPQIDKCNAIIASGQSVDTFWNEILFTIEKYPYTGYLLFSVIILFILYIILYKYFINRFRKDEGKIKLLLKEGGLEKDDIDDIVIEKKAKVTKTSTDLSPQISDEFKFKTFEPIGQGILKEPDLKAKYIPGDKVEIPKKPEPGPSVVTPPNAIQPEGPLVVITPFKTLNKPIRSLSNSPVETSKDIKTDLPPVKKKDDIL